MDKNSQRTAPGGGRGEIHARLSKDPTGPPKWRAEEEGCHPLPREGPGCAKTRGRSLRRGEEREDSQSSQTAAEQSTPRTLRTPQPHPAPCIPAPAPSRLSISLSFFFSFSCRRRGQTGGRSARCALSAAGPGGSTWRAQAPRVCPGSESGSTRFHRGLAPLLPSPSSAVTTQGARNRNRRRGK